MDDPVKTPATSPLGTKNTDRAAAIARVLAGSVPIAGPFLAEVLTAVIPNQRLDRVEAFLLLLAQELEKLSASEKITHPSSIPLIEEGVAQAARALSEERRAYLAKCVAHGVGTEDMEKLNELRLLQMLGEVGDDDLLLLDALNDQNEQNDETKLQALQPPELRGNAPDEARAKGELLRASQRRLLAIGLLSSAPYTDERRKWKIGRFGEREEQPYVSALGRMMLVRVGLSKPSNPK